MPNQSGLTDKDRMTDMLSCEKFITANWSTAANEMVQPELYQDSMQFLNEAHNAQRQLFEIMQQKGWYQTDQVSQQQISQTASQYSQNQYQSSNQFQN